ncbi:MAG: hypothetical protein PHG81_12935 [Aliarcobacter sp.]|nr:hypothetical protein [Aliarcobacter sp.]
MKKYIVKQTTNWSGRGEKTSTFVFPCGSEAELNTLLPFLDGRIEVYEKNDVLSSAVDASTVSTSTNTIDSIKFRLPGAETVYVAAFKRPIVLKSSASIGNIGETMRWTVKPFSGVFATELPSDVSIDTGNLNNL